MKLIITFLAISIVMLGMVNVQLFFLSDSMTDELEVIKAMLQDLDFDIHNLKQ